MVPLERNTDQQFLGWKLLWQLLLGPLAPESLEDWDGLGFPPLIQENILFALTKLYAGSPSIRDATFF